MKLTYKNRKHWLIPIIGLKLLFKADQENWFDETSVGDHAFALLAIVLNALVISVITIIAILYHY